MAIKLLSKKLQLTIHIALIVVFASMFSQATAQTVLLPGDIVIVSANGNAASVDFIPLIDVEKGTELYFANGLWDDSVKALTGQELKVTFSTSVEAGTNLHLNSMEDPRISLSGALDFKGETIHLFAFQKEENLHRFVFGMAWGKQPLWNDNDEDKLSSDIPASLLDSPYTLLSLGEATNHQYYIRYGASGTKDLLLKMVGNASHWRTTKESAFPVFGTSFNLLQPPVILFEESMSQVNENDSLATIAVAIYGHDGSRLSVDVVFDSSRSIMSYDDIRGYESTKLNFTGLVGDGIYKVEVPIVDDKTYEGIETGIFSLSNLTKGNYGDFLSHSLMVDDDEIPDLLISKVVNTLDETGFIEIKNKEDGVVSLNGWTLSGNEQTFSFSDTDIIYPHEAIKLLDTSNKKDVDSSERNLNSNLKKPLLKRKGGYLTLRNYKNEIIYQVNYGAALNKAKEDRNENLVIEEVKNENLIDGFADDTIDEQLSVSQIASPGWKIFTDISGLSTIFADKDIYLWSEKEHELILADDPIDSEGAQTGTIYMAHFSTDEMQDLLDWQNTSKGKQLSSKDLLLTLSATDQDGNESIDGIEGLNLVYNSLEEPIWVSSLVSELKNEYSDITVNPVVYGLVTNTNGELHFKNLDPEAEIASGAAFWLFIENELTEQEVQLNAQKLTDTVANETATKQDGGHIKLSLVQGTRTEDLLLNIGNASDFKAVKDLNSYPDLFLANQSFLNIAFQRGGDYYNELSLSDELENEVQIPVAFSTSETGSLTLSVMELEQIPADWNIRLKDVLNDKEYDLRTDFKLTFEHSNTSIEDKNGKILNDFLEVERFVIIVAPPESNKAIEEEALDAPKELELHQNYPNPFNPVTTISFYLPESKEVRLSIFNIVGQPVAVITEGTLSAGQHQFEWDATDNPSGMYIYQLEVGKSVMTRKMTLVK